MFTPEQKKQMKAALAEAQATSKKAQQEMQRNQTELAPEAKAMHKQIRAALDEHYKKTK